MIKAYTLALLVFLPVGLRAEVQVPNLAGEWKLVPAPATSGTRRKPVDPTAQTSDLPIKPGVGNSPGRTGGSFECLETCSVKQDGKTLTILQRVAGAAPGTKAHEIVLTLDGSEVKNIKSQPEGTGALDSTTTARWEENRLLVSRTIGSGVGRFEQVITIEKDVMTIVTTTFLGGAAGPGAQRPITVKYKRG
jgi:hypothetical protein